MKYLMVGFLTFICGFLLADIFFSQGNSPKHESGEIPFLHELHGESIGMDCTHCHTGAKKLANAFMPTKQDCMDCHRLPLTENKGIEELDSILPLANENPWNHKNVLPEHVVFHHGVHAQAKVECYDCHFVNGKDSYSSNQYGGENYTMQTCLNCHRGLTFKERNLKAASTFCASCHR